jgi:predicted nucleic acid-binding Zn ribbon protein
VTATATIWRTCPVCGRSFEQPDDPGRKRVYCSRACQQAAYRQRQRQGAWQQRTGRQEQRSHRQEWRSDHRQERQQRAGPGGNGAGQRQRGGQRRQE